MVAAYEDRRIVGYPDEVAALVENWRACGQLVGLRAPKAVPGTRHVAVAVRLRTQPQPAPVSARRSHRAHFIAGGSLVGAGGLVGVGYLAYSAVMAVIPLLPGAIALVLLLALAWFVLGQAGACPGVHCPGCRHH